MKIEEISDSISVDTECIGDKITVRVDAKDDDVDDFGSGCQTIRA